MRRAIATAVVAMGLTLVPARATELGLLLDKEIGRAQTLGATGSGLATGRYDSANPTGIGFRAAYTFLDLHLAELGAAVTYHPKAEADLSGPTGGKYGSQYVAIGVQADWKLLLDLHAGLDLRSEKLSTSTAGGSDSTTLTRPWVKAGVGFNLPTPVVSPFVRLEVAVPLSKEDNSNNSDDFRKAMAPSLQVALYGGIRF